MRKKRQMSMLEVRAFDDWNRWRTSAPMSNLIPDWQELPAKSRRELVREQRALLPPEEEEA